jgi:hypothetical protein
MMSQDAYRAWGRGLCPQCWHRALTPGTFTGGDGWGAHRMTCDTCGLVWDERYLLAGYVRVGNHDDDRALAGMQCVEKET